MKIKLHLPRKSEADLIPALEEDIVIKPRFYKKTGWVPVFYFTTVDAHNHEERHVMIISAASKQVRIEKLIEVIPSCDEKPKNKEAKEPTKDPSAT